MPMVQPLNEAGNGLLKIDVVFPERVIGIKEEYLRACNRVGHVPEYDKWQMVCGGWRGVVWVARSEGRVIESHPSTFLFCPSQWRQGAPSFVEKLRGFCSFVTKGGIQWLCPRQPY